MLIKYFIILIIVLSVIAFVLFVLRKYQVLQIYTSFLRNHNKHLSIDHRYNLEKAKQQKEIDAILDKISRNGINSLTDKEKEKLDKFSER